MEEGCMETMMRLEGIILRKAGLGKFGRGGGRVVEYGAEG